MKQPTDLKSLAALIQNRETNNTWNDSEQELAQQWLGFTYTSLIQRKTYMKKQQIKKSLAVKLLREHLSPDELEEVDRQAEEQAEAE